MTIVETRHFDCGCTVSHHPQSERRYQSLVRSPCPNHVGLRPLSAPTGPYSVRRA